MERLQAFQSAARQGGFVDVEETDGGTVLWLRKATPDVVSKTHQRICIDSGANVVTVYWMSPDGKIDSKSFRTPANLEEWFALRRPE